MWFISTAAAKIAPWSFFKGPEKTRPLSGVADVAVAEPRHEQQQRVVVAINQDAIDLKAIAGRFPFRP